MKMSIYYRYKEYYTYDKQGNMLEKNTHRYNNIYLRYSKLVNGNGITQSRVRIFLQQGRVVSNGETQPVNRRRIYIWTLG